MLAGIDLDYQTAARALGQEYFNLVRRGADGSLSLSADRWRLLSATPEAFHFVAQDPAAPDLIIRTTDLERLVWDQLPKQQTRSQVRFLFATGDVWSFSGKIDLTALDDENEA
jgi:hypothetical protein